jgi:hypothetical protein
MCKGLYLIAAGLGIVIFAGPIWAQTQTITGQVVSVSCYLQNKKNVGKAGYVCANADLKWEGNPPGLLADDGTIYELEGSLVANNNAKILPYLGKTVKVTGDVKKVFGIMTIKADEDGLKPADSAASQ